MVKSKISTLVSLLDDKKAENISIIDFEHHSPFYDYFVVADVSNIRQLDALADYIVDELEKEYDGVHHQEGSAESGWILIDRHDIIIHLFLREQRSHYNLEKLWSDYVVKAA